MLIASTNTEEQAAPADGSQQLPGIWSHYEPIQVPIWSNSTGFPEVRILLTVKKSIHCQTKSKLSRTYVPQLKNSTKGS